MPSLRTLFLVEIIGVIACGAVIAKEIWGWNWITIPLVWIPFVGLLSCVITLQVRVMRDIWREKKKERE